MAMNIVWADCKLNNNAVQYTCTLQEYHSCLTTFGHFSCSSYSHGMHPLYMCQSDTELTAANFYFNSIVSTVMHMLLKHRL